MSIRNSFCSERFEVDYLITVSTGQNIESLAHEICIEQTVEIPDDCIPQSHHEQGIVGVVENISPVPYSDNQFSVTISYRSDISSYSVAQFLNTTFGNISLKDNIRIEAVRIPEVLAGVFPGPAFGIDGIRSRTGVYDRPLTCTALKPVGLDSKSLSEMAYKFALGGADIIKDDHGITDQPFARFFDRVQRVHEAVMKANEESGHTTIYCPMLNDDPDNLHEQLGMCSDLGIEGVLAAPMLIGCPTFAHIARRKQFVLMAHPALCGTFFGSPIHGATPAVMLGTLFRLLGADISIFPNAGGRFNFSRNDCDGISDALRTSTVNLPSSFPAPAGGMRLDRIREMSDTYGTDTVFIVGGNLQQQPGGLVDATRAFVREVEACGGKNQTLKHSGED